MNELDETLDELDPVAVKRLGANRVHFALVMPDVLAPGSVFGVACTLTQGPLVAFCARTLRGLMVVIPEEKLDSWRKQGHVCAECQLVAVAVVRRMELELAGGDAA